MNDVDFYKSFADSFQGDRETVRRFHSVYLPLVRYLNSNSKNDKAIDLGCGRGQWLEMLKEEGFSAAGFDLDEGMLKECKKQGLMVEKKDILAALQDIPSNSVSLVTSFHVVEHLPQDKVIELLREIYRVITPGGLAILETPNPQNLWVATNNFYFDPTHYKVIPADLLSFMAKFSGFENVCVGYLHGEKDEVREQPLLTPVFFDVSINSSVICMKDPNGVVDFDKITELVFEPLSTLRDHVALYDERMLGFCDKLMHNQDEINNLQNELLRMKRSSLSWWLAKPFRWLKSRVK